MNEQRLSYPSTHHAVHLFIDSQSCLFFLSYPTPLKGSSKLKSKKRACHPPRWQVGPLPILPGMQLIFRVESLRAKIAFIWATLSFQIRPPLRESLSQIDRWERFSWIYNVEAIIRESKKQLKGISFLWVHVLRKRYALSARSLLGNSICFITGPSSTHFWRLFLQGFLDLLNYSRLTLSMHISIESEYDVNVRSCLTLPNEQEILSSLPWVSLTCSNQSVWYELSLFFFFRWNYKVPTQ